MAYLGKSPEYGAFEKQNLTPDSSTTTFTLNYTVGSSSSILVSLSGVIQQPETAYNISSGGTEIVFASAPTSGETCFVIYLGVAFETATLATGAITGQTELVTPADDDLLLIYDTDAATLKKIQKSNLAPATTFTYTTGTDTGDGSTTGFTINSGRSVNDILVIVNGIILTPTTDYTISSTTLTFTVAPASGAQIDFRYLPI